MTRPTHTHYGVYLLITIIGGILLAGLTLAARIAWAELT